MSKFRLIQSESRLIFLMFQKIYVRCLHNVHQKHPIVLENEPKYTDPRKLTSFKINAPYAQASILEFSAIIRGMDGGFVNSGEEGELEVEQESGESKQQSRESTAVQHEGKEVPMPCLRLLTRAKPLRTSHSAKSLATFEP